MGQLPWRLLHALAIAKIWVRHDAELLVTVSLNIPALLFHPRGEFLSSSFDLWFWIIWQNKVSLQLVNRFKPWRLSHCIVYVKRPKRVACGQFQTEKTWWGLVTLYHWIIHQCFVWSSQGTAPNAASAVKKLRLACHPVSLWWTIHRNVICKWLSLLRCELLKIKTYRYVKW